MKIGIKSSNQVSTSITYIRECLTVQLPEGVMLFIRSWFLFVTAVIFQQDRQRAV